MVEVELPVVLIMETGEDTEEAVPLPLARMVMEVVLVVLVGILVLEEQGVILEVASHLTGPMVQVVAAVVVVPVHVEVIIPLLVAAVVG
jgi:hypothetical protein